jgi:hypothetical protein
MSTILKRKLSGSTDGKPIKVTGTATAGADTIHTAVAGTTAGTYDEIWISAQNNSADSVTLTIEMGGTSVPDNVIVCTLASKGGPQLIIPGLILQNAKVVKAFASSANVISLIGYVNAFTD